MMKALILLLDERESFLLREIILSGASKHDLVPQREHGGRTHLCNERMIIAKSRPLVAVVVAAWYLASYLLEQSYSSPGKALNSSYY